MATDEEQRVGDTGLNLVTHGPIGFVWIVYWADPCTMEHEIVRVIDGDDEDGASAHAYVKQCNERDPSGPDHYAKRWPVWPK